MALGVTGIAFAFPMALERVLGSLSPFIMFILAVFISAGFGGLVPGLLSTAIGVGYGINLVSNNANPDYRAIAVFGVTGLLLSSVNEALYRTRVRADHVINQKQAELEALNERLRRAMMETHHRVKNNLQSVAAVVDIELMKHGETIPAAEVARIRDYVQCLASLHRVLTQKAKDDAAAETVSSRAALENLIPLLQQGTPLTRISLAADDVPLPMRQVTAVCILTNELVHNASRVSRNVEVGFAVTGRTAVLSVTDDGPGFGQAPEREIPASTGIELVQSVSEWDLGGQVSFANRESGGAQVAIKFAV